MVIKGIPTIAVHDHYTSGHRHGRRPGNARSRRFRRLCDYVRLHLAHLLRDGTENLVEACPVREEPVRLTHAEEAVHGVIFQYRLIV